MKIWKEFNSSHSSNITIIGQFEKPNDLEKAFALIEDFILGAWEERFPSITEFNEHWALNFHPDIPYLGITNDEYQLGIDNVPDIHQNIGSLTISHFRNNNLGGIIKLLRFVGAKKITIQ